MHSYNCFKDTKEELLNERIKFLKIENMKEYAMSLGKAQQKYTETLINVTRLAAEFIELD